MGFFNFKCKPTEELKPLPKMSNAKLSKLIKAITEGKVIQMCWSGCMEWGNMAPRSLEQFLDVFLEERWGFPVWFRVKPEEVPNNLESIQNDVGSVFVTLHKLQTQVDNLYDIVLKKESK
jgi:hypothetical protein